MIADIIGYVAPALVAVLTAGAGVLEVQFRDADAYEKRRGVWQWLLVLLAAVATMAATNAASSDGSLLQAALLGTFAAAAVVVAHLMWRRLIPDPSPRNRTIATTAAVAAVAVVAASVTVSYTAGTPCRQVKPLVQVSLQTYSALYPKLDPTHQGPTTGDFDLWAKTIREQAAQVEPGPVGDHAAAMSDLAGQIADAVHRNQSAEHAVLGTKYEKELTAVMGRCHIPLPDRKKS